MGTTGLKHRFSLAHLLNLFLVSAFPFHLWILIMLIRDSDSVIARSGADSFLGLAAVSMVYALAESILLFLLLNVLGLLIPWRWKAERVFAISGFIALWLPFWDVLSQVYRAAELDHPQFLVTWLFSTGHPLRFGYILAGSLVFVLIALSAFLIWSISFNQKMMGGMVNILERIALLSGLYLVLDVISVVVVVARNIG